MNRATRQATYRKSNFKAYQAFRRVKTDFYMKFFSNIRSRLSILAELWAFMRVRKKWWLGPIILALVLLGLVVVMTEGSALAPFIYTLF